MIRIMKRSGLFLLLLAAAVSCKKNGGDEAPNPPLPEPKAVERGKAEGTPVVKSIGPAGGTIQSADGNIALNIPAGAVSAATTFTIQPVSNTLSGGTGPSYRLLPENVQFRKDVKITLKYSDEDLIGTTEDDLYMAYQDAEGFWYRHILTGIDKTAKKLTAQTRHFSDWTIERIFRVEIAKDERIREANQYAVLWALFQDVEKATGKIIEGVMIPDNNIETWFATGPGTFDNLKHHKAIYTAPASIPQVKEIAVGIRVKNLVNKRNPDRPGNTGLVIVQVPITLVPDESFVWEVDDAVYVAHSTDALIVGSNITLIGTGLKGQISINAKSAVGVGKYEAGSVEEDRKFEVQLSFANGNPPIYLTAYYPCGSSGVRYGSGAMDILKFGDIGNVISGSLTATVYAPGTGCNPKTKKVTGQFKLKRKL